MHLWVRPTLAIITAVVVVHVSWARPEDGKTRSRVLVPGSQQYVDKQKRDKLRPKKVVCPLCKSPGKIYCGRSDSVIRHIRLVHPEEELPLKVSSGYLRVFRQSRKSSAQTQVPKESTSQAQPAPTEEDNYIKDIDVDVIPLTNHQCPLCSVSSSNWKEHNGHLECPQCGLTVVTNFWGK